MNKLDIIYNIIKENKVHASNQMLGKGLGVSFSFIQLPHNELIPVSTTVITMSVMYNRRRKNALGYAQFAKLMRTVEDILFKFSTKPDDIYNTPLTGKIPDKWYSYLSCHRVFLIPTVNMLGVLGELMSKKIVKEMNQMNLKEVFATVSTEQQDWFLQAF